MACSIYTKKYTPSRMWFQQSFPVTFYNFVQVTPNFVQVCTKDFKIKSEGCWHVTAASISNKYGGLFTNGCIILNEKPQIFYKSYKQLFRKQIKCSRFWHYMLLRSGINANWFNDFKKTEFCVVSYKKIFQKSIRGWETQPQRHMI